jgi:hypothetical protein
MSTNVIAGLPSGEMLEGVRKRRGLGRRDVLLAVPNASHDISARPSLLIAKVSYVLAWLAAHDTAAP